MRLKTIGLWKLHEFRMDELQRLKSVGKLQAELLMQKVWKDTTQCLHQQSKVLNKYMQTRGLRKVLQKQGLATATNKAARGPVRCKTNQQYIDMRPIQVSKYQAVHLCPLLLIKAVKS